MSAAVLLFALHDAGIKLLAARFGVPQILFLRTAIALLLILAAAAYVGRHALTSAMPGAQILRAALQLCSAATFFYAFGHLPLADAYAIFYMAPLAMSLLAALVLGERVGRRAVAAIALGLVGVLVVVAPNIEGSELRAYLACVVGTLAYAGVGVVTRRMREERGLATLFYAALTVVLATAPFMPGAWLTPSAGELAIFLFVALLWPAAVWMFVIALRYAPIARLAPLEYGSIVWVVAIDAFVFGLSPSLTTLAGSAIVIAACLLLMERRRLR
jgi:drug/metabolite transporter (DMT)-like permease